MAEKDKRYYWLKLKKDFFKRHDIQIIENMPNGKDYILFYLKLLCESVDHDGNLRFSEQIPYNENMLSTITNTNVDIVRSAITVFSQLQMMEVMDDGTYYMTEVNKMLGSETYWAQRKREQRELELEEIGQCPTVSNEFPTCPSKSKRKSKSIEIDKDKDIDIEKEELPKGNSKPSKHKYGEYQHVLLTDNEYENIANTFGQDMLKKSIKFLDEYIEEKGYKSKSHNLAIRRWVIQAVQEQEAKEQRKQNYSGYQKQSKAEELDEFYNMAANWAEGE